jgi:uncharacterized membrane protein
MVSIPWIYLATIWNQLPQTVAVHFGASGEADRFGDKSEVLIGPAIGSLISILLYLLMTNIHKIDPKRFKNDQSQLFNKAANGLVVFLTAISILTMHWSLKQEAVGLNILLMLIGVFFAYLGNLMHSIKPNYFFGIRLPWTLESEENWKSTHLLASKIWFAGGVFIALLALIVPPFAMFFIMMGFLIIMVAIPIVHSYRLFKNQT